MSQYTREEIKEMVKHGESLTEADLKGIKLRGANLNGINLRGANLSEADLFMANLTYASLGLANLWKANLSKVNFSGAIFWNATLKEANLRRANLSETDLAGANLKDCDLCLANLNQANLTGANLTGANIWGIANTGWIIDGIKVEYIYIYSKFQPSKEAKEKTRQDFKPGEFEVLYKSLPVIEMVFKEGFSPLDYIRLVGVTEIIRQQKPDVGLKMKSMENIGLDTILRFTLSQDEYLEQAARLIVQLSQERGLGQRLLPILKDQGIQLTEPGQPTFNIGKMEINFYTASGEPKGKMGDIIIGKQEIHDSSVAIGNNATANYNTHQSEVDELLAELSETNQVLVEVLTAALRANDQDKVQSTWKQIKEGISTGAAAYSILTTLGRLLGLPV